MLTKCMRYLITNLSTLIINSSTVKDLLKNDPFKGKYVFEGYLTEAQRALSLIIIVHVYKQSTYSKNRLF